MESNCAGLILHRQKPPLTRRSLVYYCSGVHSRYGQAFCCQLLQKIGGPGWIRTSQQFAPACEVTLEVLPPGSQFLARYPQCLPPKPEPPTQSRPICSNLLWGTFACWVRGGSLGPPNQPWVVQMGAAPRADFPLPPRHQDIEHVCTGISVYVENTVMRGVFSDAIRASTEAKAVLFA